MLKRQLLAAALLCPLAALSSAQTVAARSAAASSAASLTFDVYLDDSPIGEHRFVVAREGGVKTVDSTADFEVKLLFITAFAYEHRNREVWRDGCLTSISARTDSNGDASFVEGEALASGFRVRTMDGPQRLGSCVRTFAYWDRALLEAPRLLNSQTGEHVEVSLDALGAGQLDIGGTERAVKRYSLRGEDVLITLYYDAVSDDWVALDTRLDSGRTLQYRRRAASPEAAASARTVPGAS